MLYEEPITRWISSLKEGDDQAIQKVWERYFEKLVRLARQHLSGLPRRVADEEDVALSAFNSFCQAATQGRFPQLNERESLWKLLITITIRKAKHFRRDQFRLKRDPHRLVDPAPTSTESGSLVSPLDNQAADEPTPDFAAEMAEQTEQLLNLLQEKELKQIALWKMDGYTNEEIATGLNCALSTVERRLRLIRDLWSKELPDEP
jgi:RNA polymerase sigma factor (sigma-70 family)